ncbi:MAG: hypothetical protein COV79_04410 [Parcubacteria group bacterium CG11_big_fil_rev_8_21_14_0_20_41_14]|nr:MAG: hypothetical protein COW93_00485 [Parcubacteria group bacterium CG22_combo_CG10-13_8_21_14_all_41_9]PIQ79055.1 MAG: hypothetical protein COV79_04410 [Parcubacteria group bacterium CG11_big_fil_rev_8_21_14_0_20_41_14]
MGRIFIGILMTAAGFMMVWKTEAIVQFTGYNAWAEDKLGTMGGTRLLTKLIGLIVIFGGMLAITNMHQSFLQATIGKLVSGRM